MLIAIALAIFASQILIWRALLRIDRKQRKTLKLQETTMADLSKLQADVAANTTVEQSAVTLIQGIAQQLKDANASGDQAAIDALAAQLEASSQALSDAITANTPAAPPPAG